MVLGGETMNTKSTRVFHVSEQIKNIYNGAKGFVLLRSSKKERLMNKKLKEQIMLAITEVNGCAMCSYMHTKIALSAGMSREEIMEILDGNTSNIPVENAVAVVFAQDFAYSKEVLDPKSVARIVEEYGYKKAQLIVAACRVITMTNGMGISMDDLYHRIQFKRNKESNLLNEVLNPLLTMVLFPVFTLFFAVKCLSGRRPRTLKLQYQK